MNNYPFDLYLFDIDGTLIDRDTGKYLPGVKEWFDAKPTDTAVALITNQGGPACREAGWGDRYPSLDYVLEKYGRIADELNAMLYMSLAYCPRDWRDDMREVIKEHDGSIFPSDIHGRIARRWISGEWMYPKQLPRHDIRLRHTWRKPNNGMIVQAIRDFGLDEDVMSSTGKVVMVGDRFTDWLAAAMTPGCSYIDPRGIFGPKTTKEFEWWPDMPDFMDEIPANIWRY